MIDLRSDSSSTPTPQMRQAMAEAAVGNDAFREDPSVNELERRAAALFSKQAGLFTASGTMSNLVAVLTAAGPGQAVLAGRTSHLVRFEAGAPSRLGGIFFVPFADPRGRMDLAELRDFLDLPSSLDPCLLALENTHNSAGGAVLRLDEMHAYADLAHRKRMHVYLDGARALNAAVALGEPPERVGERVDSLAFCLSKGLSAPVGSVLVGSQDFIDRARATRFQLGGQMRQAGVLAAAGLAGLEDALAQIALDHRNARMLAEGLARIPGLGLDPESVETNIVLFDVSGLGVGAEAFEARLESRGLFASVFTSRLIRFITYRDIGPAAVEEVLEIVRAVADEVRAA